MKPFTKPHLTTQPHYTARGSAVEMVRGPAGGSPRAARGARPGGRGAPRSAGAAGSRRGGTRAARGSGSRGGGRPRAGPWGWRLWDRGGDNPARRATQRLFRTCPPLPFPRVANVEKLHIHMPVGDLRHKAIARGGPDLLFGIQTYAVIRGWGHLRVGSRQAQRGRGSGLFDVGQ